MVASDDLWEGIRNLTWHQHEGSGTTLTYHDVMDLDFNRFMEWCEWVQSRREKESNAMKRAMKR